MSLFGWANESQVFYPPPGAAGLYHTWAKHHSINTDIPPEEQDVKHPEFRMMT